MTIDPRIPTLPGRSKSGFHRRGRHCKHHARSAVRCSASCMKGELHPTENRLWGGLSSIWMTTTETMIFFPVWPLPETAMGLLCTASWVPYHKRYVIRSFALCGLKLSPPRTNDRTRPPVAATAKKRTDGGGIICCEMCCLLVKLFWARGRRVDGERLRILGRFIYQTRRKKGRPTKDQGNILTARLYQY